MVTGGRISRDTVVAAARRLLERDGMAGFSIRRLAADLGSKPMTLYHYVPSKAKLLDLVLSAVAAEIDWPDPDGTPRERMLALALGMHRELAGLPWLLPILQRGTQIGPPALVLADRFLSAALEEGASEREALGLWRSAWYLVSADLAYRMTLPDRAPDEHSWFETDIATTASDFPAVSSLLGVWPEFSAAYTVDDSLAALIEGSAERWARTAAATPAGSAADSGSSDAEAAGGEQGQAIA